jgi:serine/threonine-protein kinase
VRALEPERWSALSPYLDKALELPPEERSLWLSELRSKDPSVADDIEALLDEWAAAGREGFLERGALLPEPPSLEGRTVGAYTLVAPIGQGGMGSVWLADRNDGRFEGRVAVKLLNVPRIGREGEERFKREADILARLTHPHIARLLDAGVSPFGQPYLVLELVEGQPIDRHCDERALAVEARLRMMLDVMAAVSHAHAHLVVHRDIKSSNVLVAPEGGVKLLDFGIAKLLRAETEGEEGSSLTREGEAAFTPGYAAPEQLTGGEITTATDVYSLGVLLFELLSGQHPFGARWKSIAEWVRALDSPPARLSERMVSGPQVTSEALDRIAATRGRTAEQLHRQFRGDLDTILGKALKTDPGERYRSVAAFGDDLVRYLDHHPISARADRVLYRAAKFVRRNRLSSALAAAAVVSLAAGFLGTVTQAKRATAQRAIAERERIRADEEARAASAERDFALRQLSRAEALNDLNGFVLSDAAPLGRPFTARELLSRAEQIVERQRGDTANQVELLIAIGRQYATLDEEARAREVLERAYSLSIGLPESWIRAKSACALASTVTYGGDAERGRKLVREALADLPAAEPSLALDRIFCLLRASEIGREVGDYDDAVGSVLAARDLLGTSRLTSTVLELSVAMSLAESYRMAGRNREASRAFEDASETLSALGREDTETAGTLLNNWGLAVMALGRPLEAEDLFRRAMAKSRGDVSPMLLNNLARTLRELGRLEEARALAERAYASARETGAEHVVGQALMVRATVYRLQGDLDRAGQMLAELEPRWRSAFPAGSMAFANLASEQSILAQARGDLRAAVEASDRAIAIAEKDAQRIDYLPGMLERRSNLDRVRGHLEEAQSYAERALSMEQEAAGPDAVSHRIGRAHLALGLALEAQGKGESARSELLAALEHLEPCLGADHPDTQLARRLAHPP